MSYWTLKSLLDSAYSDRLDPVEVLDLLSLPADADQWNTPHLNAVLAYLASEQEDADRWGLDRRERVARSLDLDEARYRLRLAIARNEEAARRAAEDTPTPTTEA